MMKRIVLLVLSALLLSVVLAGCAPAQMVKSEDSYEYYNTSKKITYVYDFWGHMTHKRWYNVSGDIIAQADYSTDGKATGLSLYLQDGFVDKAYTSVSGGSAVENTDFTKKYSFTEEGSPKYGTNKCMTKKTTEEDVQYCTMVWSVSSDLTQVSTSWTFYLSDGTVKYTI